MVGATTAARWAADYTAGEMTTGAGWVKEAGARVEPGRPLDDLKVQAPGIVRNPAGGWRLFYTAVGSDRPFAACQGYILSAVSDDGVTFEPEPGIRIRPDPRDPDMSLRALAPSISKLPDGRWRMYFESRGEADHRYTIRSAISEDQLHWTLEPGPRLAAFDRLGGPRFTPLPGGGGRLYCCASRWAAGQAKDSSGGERETVGVVSAVTEDGLEFELEPGVRKQGGTSEIASGGITAADVIAPARPSAPGASWIMVYSCWQEPPAGSVIPPHPSEQAAAVASGVSDDFAALSIASDLAGFRSRLFVASSDDGLTFGPGELVLEGDGYEGAGIDAVHAEDMCLAELGGGRYRVYYASCDTRGTWRVASAIASLGGATPT